LHRLSQLCFGIRASRQLCDSRLECLFRTLPIPSPISSLSASDQSPGQVLFVIFLIGNLRRAELFQMVKRSLRIAFRPVPAFEGEVGGTSIEV